MGTFYGGFIFLTLVIHLHVLPSSLLILDVLLLPTLVMHKFYGEDVSIEILENSIIWQLFYPVLAMWYILIGLVLYNE